MVAAYASARDRLGKTLCGKYHLDDVLGVGGTAVVFLATDRDGRRVAVKLLHDYLCASRDVTRRFLRETYLANLLDHPGTVRVIDDDVDEDGVAFLVLELLDGETLEERRVRLGGRLGIDEVLSYMDRLLEVLELAHEKQIVHRDIKPSNLFLTNTGTLKVLDFGIARILDQHGAATATKTGQMIGTPAFMPPEQALSKPREIDKQTDLWSVGATMFTLLSGELVHIAESPSEHLVKAATLHARSVARVLPGIPSNVETLIGRALRFEKKDRWASATEMRMELSRVRLDPGRPVGTTSSPPPYYPSSDFPTVMATPDSSRVVLRETGMSLTDMPYPSENRTRRAVFVSAVIAVLLVASALSFAIWMTAFQKPQVSRTAVAATGDPGPPPLLPMSLDPIASATSVTVANFAKPATTDVPAADPPHAASSISVANPGAPPKGAPAKGAGGIVAKPGGKHPTPALTADLYKPF
jgi:serine/threonine-protein kinase